MIASHLFSNGIRLHRAELLDIQIARYSAPGNPNLHEPVEEDWLLRTFAVSKGVRPLFVDIGAAVGYYSILIRQAFPEARVVAVEPLPQHVAALEANVALNDLPIDAIDIAKVAIGPYDGEAQFVDKNFSSHLRRSETVSTSIAVKTMKLSTFVAAYEPIHLAKMDIQGAEVDVLSASQEMLAAGHIRHLVLGTHGTKLHIAARTLLEQSGFEIACDDPAPAMQPDGLIVATHLRPA